MESLCESSGCTCVCVSVCGEEGVRVCMCVWPTCGGSVRGSWRLHLHLPVVSLCSSACDHLLCVWHVFPYPCPLGLVLSLLFFFFFPPLICSSPQVLFLHKDASTMRVIESPTAGADHMGSGAGSGSSECLGCVFRWCVWVVVRAVTGSTACGCLPRLGWGCLFAPALPAPYPAARAHTSWLWSLAGLP